MNRGLVEEGATASDPVAEEEMTIKDVDVREGGATSKISVSTLGYPNLYPLLQGATLSFKIVS